MLANGDCGANCLHAIRRSSHAASLAAGQRGLCNAAIDQPGRGDQKCLPAADSGSEGFYCKPSGIAYNVDGRNVGNSQVKLNAGTQGRRRQIVVSNRMVLYDPFNIPA